MHQNQALSILPLLVMIMVYIFVLGVSIKRCMKLVFEKNKSVFYGKIFYGNIFILLVLRIALEIVLIIDIDADNSSDNDREDYVVIIFWIPTLLVSVAYFILICQLNIMFFHSRLNIDQIDYSSI
jgi:hypothetical protein